MKYSICSLSLVFLMLNISCHTAGDIGPSSSGKSTDTNDTTQSNINQLDTSWTNNFIVDQLAYTSSFHSGLVTGYVKDLTLNEISGIVSASYCESDCFWVEEDSGNPNVISLLNPKGDILGDLKLTDDADRDWEDIARGPGTDLSKSYLYLADIGNNDYHYDVMYIYQFEEPEVTEKDSVFHLATKDVLKIQVKYPDSYGSQNAEALLVDPMNGDIYIFTKENYQSGVFVLPFEKRTDSVNTLVKVGTLPISKVTGADISRDGTSILVKNYVSVFHWNSSQYQKPSRILQKTPDKVRYIAEEQGESIGFNRDNTGFYTMSELSTMDAVPIYWYARE